MAAPSLERGGNCTDWPGQCNDLTKKNDNETHQQLCISGWRRAIYGARRDTRCTPVPPPGLDMLMSILMGCVCVSPGAWGWQIPQGCRGGMPGRDAGETRGGERCQRPPQMNHVLLGQGQRLIYIWAPGWSREKQEARQDAKMVSRNPHGRRQC